MENAKLGVKINNLREQYASIKRESQIASETLGGIFSEIDKKTAIFKALSEKTIAQAFLLSETEAKKEATLLRIQKEEVERDGLRKKFKGELSVMRTEADVARKVKQAIAKQINIINEDKKKAGQDLKDLVILTKRKHDKEAEFQELQDRIKGEEERLANIIKTHEQEFVNLNKEKGQCVQEMKDIKDKVYILQRSADKFKENIAIIRKQLMVKEADLTTLSHRLRNEFKKIGRPMFVKPIIIPKFKD